MTGDGAPAGAAREEHALDLWRAGDRLARQRSRAPDWRDDYEAAISGAVAVLRRHGSMAELVAAYFADEREADWLWPLCQRPGGRVLNVGIVEDAAYWRRLRQLLDRAAEPDGGNGAHR